MKLSLRMLPALILPVLLLGGCKEAPVLSENRQTAEFPAYQEGREEYNQAIYDTPAFTVSMNLPEGWELLAPPVDERNADGPFFTPLDIYRGERYMGSIGFGTYEEQADVPRKEYYKAVYSQIRLGSLYYWDDYKPVTTTDTGETASATVYYKAPEDENAADVPYTEVPGVLVYNRELRVYAGIQFAPDTVTPEIARAVAATLTLEAGGK